MSPISWQELVAQPLGAIPFLIDPYVPEGGIILLYGKTRVGKSPLTWEVARCIGSGESFFGHATRQGRVLYLEFDAPRRLVQPRVELLPTAPNVWWEFLPACHIVNSPVQARLREWNAEVAPDIVIVNTLRGVHQGDEKDGSLPLRVYTTFQAIFPRAAIWFTHHDKKSQGNPEDMSDPDEAFSGHMAWLNHCQTGIHLVRFGGREAGLMLLRHTKSQVAAEASPLTLQLDTDGSHLVGYSSSRLKEILTVYHALPPDASKTERVRLVAKHVGLGERQVWTYLSRLPDATAATAHPISH